MAHLFTDGRARMTLSLWLAYVTSLLGHYFLTSWLPTVLVGAGVPLAHAVIAGGLLSGGGAVGGFIFCWLLDKCGIALVAMAFVLAAPLILLIAFSARVSDFVLMTAAFITGTCLMGGQTALNAVSGTLYPTYIRSTGTGWANGVGRIGSIWGPVLGGVLISSTCRPPNCSSSQQCPRCAARARCTCWEEQERLRPLVGPARWRRFATVPFDSNEPSRGIS